MVDHNFPQYKFHELGWYPTGYTMGIPHLHYRFPSYDSWPCLKQVYGLQPLAASLTRADGSAECHCVGYMRQRMDWEAIELMKSALPLHAWPSVKLWQEYISLWNIPLNDSRFNFPDSVLTASSGWAAIRFTTWKRSNMNSLVSSLSPPPWVPNKCCQGAPPTCSDQRATPENVRLTKPRGAHGPLPLMTFLKGSDDCIHTDAITT